MAPTLASPAVRRFERIASHFLHDVEFRILVVQFRRALEQGKVTEHDLRNAVRFAIALRRAEERETRDARAARHERMGTR